MADLCSDALESASDDGVLIGCQRALPNAFDEVFVRVCSDGNKEYVVGTELRSGCEDVIELGLKEARACTACELACVHDCACSSRQIGPRHHEFKGRNGSRQA